MSPRECVTQAEEMPHTPLLAQGTPTHDFQQKGAPHTTSEGCRDIPMNCSAESQGRCPRLRCVKNHGPLVLMMTVVGGVIVGAVITLAAVRFAAPGCPSSPPPSPSCPNKWMRSDDRCFFISRKSNDWKSSLEFCQSEGGTLLTNQTQQEILTLYDLSGDYWVGLRKEAGSGEWKQLDGSVWMSPIQFDGPQRNCSVIDPRNYVALDCSTGRRWICVKSLQLDQ